MATRKGTKRFGLEVGRCRIRTRDCGISLLRLRRATISLSVVLEPYLNLNTCLPRCAMSCPGLPRLRRCAVVLSCLQKSVPQDDVCPVGSCPSLYDNVLANLFAVGDVSEHGVCYPGRGVSMLLYLLKGRDILPSYLLIRCTIVLFCLHECERDVLPP
jgi:hypothetical protein